MSLLFSSTADAGGGENHYHSEASKQPGNQKQSVVVFFIVIHFPFLPVIWVPDVGRSVPTLKLTRILHWFTTLCQLGRLLRGRLLRGIT